MPTFLDNIMPGSPGQNIGSGSLPWNITAQNLTVQNLVYTNPATLTINTLNATNITSLSTLAVKNFESIRFADQYTGGDCGAKINAADADLGSTPGEIWVNQNCGLTIVTAVNIGSVAPRVLRFIQGGTWLYSAAITLGARSGIIGTPGAWSDDDVSLSPTAVVLKQANNTNLATAIIAPNLMSFLQDVTIDGNRSNNATGTVGLLVTNQRFHIFRGMIEEFSSDAIQQTSTGSTDNAAAMFISHSSIIRNTGNAIACTNSSDTRIFYSFLEFNGKAGFSGTNCNSPIISFNEISSNTPGITLTGSSTANILTGSYPIIALNSGANNICTAVGANLGADININGFDGTVGGQVPDSLIETNRWVGSNATNNTCDSIHIQDSANTIIKGNTFSSNVGHTYRYAVGIFSVSATEGRDNVEGNNFLGTYGTASHIGTTATVFQNNNENGASTLEEFDVNNLVIPNNQSFFAKQVGGTAVNWVTPYTNLNHTLFSNTGGLFDFVNNGTTGVQITSTGLNPGTAGTSDVGTTALPFGNLWLGTAATNNFKFQPAATAQATTITMADPALASVGMPFTIAKGSTALPTASITTTTCNGGTTATATGTLSTDVIDWSFNAAPTATNKYGAFLVVYAVPSTNTVTFYVCNPSATTSTPTAMTVNWTVVR